MQVPVQGQLRSHLQATREHGEGLYLAFAEVTRTSCLWTTSAGIAMRSAGSHGCSDCKAGSPKGQNPPARGPPSPPAPRGSQATRALLRDLVADAMVASGVQALSDSVLCNMLGTTFWSEMEPTEVYNERARLTYALHLALQRAGIVYNRISRTRRRLVLEQLKSTVHLWQQQQAPPPEIMYLPCESESPWPESEVAYVPVDEAL